MRITNFFRVIRRGISSFQRNGWLSVATISIMTIALVVAGSLLVVNDLAKTVTQEFQDKIDISTYFKEDAPETQVLETRKFILENPKVKSVEYISKQEAWETFKDRHQDNEVITSSIEEVGSNPLYATLNIKAFSPSDYPDIAAMVSKSNFSEYIQKVNYEQNKTAIEKFSSIISAITKSGLFTAIFLSIIVVLVTFNTIRLTIYTHKQEIEIMKLVGGSNWFIRGPFIVEGILFGIFSAMVSMFLLYLGIFIISTRLTSFLPSSDLINFYMSNFWPFLFMEIGIGVVLGVISSFIAIRKYLNV